MTIRITRVRDTYVAEVTPPHGGDRAWTTTEPLRARELIEELSRRGCHQTDIGDAFYEADEAWLLRLERDVGDTVHLGDRRSQRDEIRLAEARSALESAGLPDGSWALDELRDDRLCLLIEGDHWVAGYSERGLFSPEFSETDTAAAVTRFADWVRSTVESSEASATATAEWLRRTGRKRP
jgi:hypothetical protein